MAKGIIRFPDLVPANLLRGAFGLALRRVNPHTYNAVFAPLSGGSGPSGLANPPRPFVFRAAHLAGCTVTAGQQFFFDLHLFDTRTESLIGTLATAFCEMGARGIGAHRSPAELESISVSGLEVGFERKFCAGTGLGFERKFPLCLSLVAGAEHSAKITIRFVTATELKVGGGLADRPLFPVLACRARDRISALQTFYGSGPPAIDFLAFAERAADVWMTKCEVTRVQVDRRSSRTGQVHPLGGFVGLAEYEGELAAFLPFLRAAQWTGVGRQTVWGKGEMMVLT